jgi:phosphatidylserine/phosphatidylglycerophosphate/cardiolipin synthase-like enzyme
VELLAFLDALCRRRPELEVTILAWDFNPVFALEREWLQRAVFALGTASNLRFEFDATHPSGGSHHQKLAVIDASVGFAGGIDFACSRWDDRAHRADNPLRTDNGSPGKPYHDVMAYVQGSAVRELERLFIQRWEAAVGERLEPVPDSDPVPEIADAIPVAAREVGLCRTMHSGRECVSEVLELHRRAISEAERLVYIETQYFTAGAVHDALVERMRRSPISVVLVMPEGADTPKERLVLGAAQERLLRSLSQEAERLGSQFRLLSTLASGPAELRLPTFIHSKVLLVDDRLLAVGSANLTNRSLLLDSELTLAFEETERPDGEVARAVARLRAELLGEHAGVLPDLEFFACDGLVARLDTLLASGKSRLALRQIDEELATVTPVVHLEQLFDPQKPLTEIELSELVGVDFESWISARHSATATTRQSTTSIPTPTQSNR